MVLRVWLLPLAILVFVFPATPTIAAKTFSVCGAFDQISLLNGKKVSVRGIWITDIEHNGIFPYRCSSSQKPGADRLVGIRLKFPQRNTNLEAALHEQDQTRAQVDGLRQLATFHGTIHQTSGTGHLNQYTLEMRVDKITSLKRVRYGPNE